MYIYGAPCKARNFNIVYTVYGPMFVNAESYPVAHLCVNTLLATKITLITDGI
jgi:hypothetical protein